MQVWVKYINQYKKYIILIFLCLCFFVQADSQHRKASKKKSHSESSSHKKSSSHQSSNSHHKKSSGKSKKSKHSESHSKKSKKRSGRGKKHHKRGRHGHPYVDNDERDEEPTTAYTKVEPVADNSPLRQAFMHPPDAAKPWVFWYWIQASVFARGNHCRFGSHERRWHRRCLFNEY